MSSNYVLPNRVGYIDFIQNKFHPDKVENYKETVLKKSFVHQALIDRYINIDSPYRGLLLYHELGTGKTATSITLVNQYLRAKKKIYIILPASLRNNYIKELILRSDFRHLKSKTWSFDSKNKAFVHEGGKTMKECSDIEKISIETAIKEQILKRIDFIHYNGLTETKINQLKGKINLKDFDNFIHDVKWKRVYGLGKADIKKLYNIDISGNFYKDITGKKYVLLPNLRKDLKDIEKVSILDSLETDKDNIKKVIDIIKKNVLAFIDILQLKDYKIKDSVFSDSLVIIDEAHSFIRTVSNKSKLSTQLYEFIMNAKRCKILLLSGTPIINNPYEVLHLCNLIRGPIISYRFDGKLDLTKYLKYIDFIEYKNNKTIIQLLPDYFIKVDDINITRSNSKSTAILRKIDKNYETIVDYAFPADEESFKKTFYNYSNNEHIGYINDDIFKRRIMGLVSFVDKNTSDFPDAGELIIRYVYLSDPQFKQLLENLIKEAKIEETNKKKKAINKNDDGTSVYKTYSRAVSNFSFPEGIKRNFPSDFNNLLTNYDSDDYKGENDYDDHLKDIKNKFIKKVNDITDVVERNNLLQSCSAKYVELIKDAEGTEGKVLIYSQFRTLEGVGMLSVYLDILGFKKVEATKDSFKIPDSDKNYMIYSLDKDIASEQIKRFNSKDNIRGKQIKILIITLSGAEGISLTNVRAVLMLEPHWNMTILKQVIGRAVRNGSHKDLPEDERTVKTYLYLTEATEKQIQDNETFRIQNNSKTTDQVIYEKSKLKQKNIDDLLMMMKQSAFDCNIHTNINGIDCYKWAYNLDKKTLTYKSNLKDEFSHMLHKKYEKEKEIEGKLVTYKNRKVVEYEGKYYDFHAYKYAKQLIPIDDEYYKANLETIKVIDNSKKDREPTKEPIKPIKEPTKHTGESDKPSKEPIKPTEEPIKPTKEPTKHTGESEKPSKEPIKHTGESEKPSKEPIKHTKETEKPRYKVVDVKGDGSCFYRAIYVSLREQNNIMKFIKCFSLRSGLKETVTEKNFVLWIREFLSKRTLKGNDNNISSNTYQILKKLSLEEYKILIEHTWNIKILIDNKPEKLATFRQIISEYIGDISKYANEYDKKLLESFCENTIKFIISNFSPKKDFKFEPDTVYLRRIYDNHCQVLI